MTAVPGVRDARTRHPSSAGAPDPDRGSTAAHRPGAARADIVPAAVLGLGSYLPTRVRDNASYAAALDTSDAWIRQRTGIASRHVAGAHEATGDMALAAARDALAEAGLAGDDLGAILVATSSPDHPLPATAPWVAARLGSQAAALDCNAVCSGFVYALRLAAGLLATGTAPVLVIGADLLSRAVDPDDRVVAPLFGDGAGAMILGAGHGSLGPFLLGSDGTDPSVLWQRAGGSRHPLGARGLDEREGALRMRGQEIYRAAVTRMTEAGEGVLAAAGLEPGDVDLFIGHQANARILDAVVRRLGLDPAVAHTTVDRHGNTSAASLPLALADARAAGRLRPGARVLLVAFGAGLTWGGCLLTLPPT